MWGKVLAWTAACHGSHQRGKERCRDILQLRVLGKTGSGGREQPLHHLNARTPFPWGLNALPFCVGHRARMSPKCRLQDLSKNWSDVSRSLLAQPHQRVDSPAQLGTSFALRAAESLENSAPCIQVRVGLLVKIAISLTRILANKRRIAFGKAWKRRNC